MTSASARSFLTSAALAVLATALLCVTPANASDGFFHLRGGLRIMRAKSMGATVTPSSSIDHSSFSNATLFPTGCNCERSNRKSPFRLILDGPASGSEPGLQRFCFRVDNVGGCDPSLYCCNGQQGVYKAEFDVVAGCKDSLSKVTVNGNTSSYEFNTQLSVLRVTGLNQAPAAAPGTEICLFLATASKCPGLAQLCSAGAGLCKYALFNANRDCCPVGLAGSSTPSTQPTSPSSQTASPSSTAPLPPPPPFPQVPSHSTAPATRTQPQPGAAFPFSECQRDSSDARLFTTASTNVTVVNGLTRVCFSVGAKDVCANPASKCCQFALYKMEIEADAACADALAYTTVDGAKRARFFQTSPYPVIKVTNLEKPFAQAAGTEVCLFLRPQCNSLAKLCSRHDGTCTIGLFNKPNSASPRCCPLSTV